MRIAAVLAITLAAFAADRRNTQTPNTDTLTSFTAPADPQQWAARRAQLRTQVLSAAGLLPMPAKTPLNSLVYDRMEHADYTIEKVALETRPGYWLGGNLYRPNGRPGPFPAVLHPHGHWSYGRLENSNICSSPTLAINLARKGFVVFAYDMVGYTDTTQTPHDFTSPTFQLWGFTPLGLQLWNSIRVLDYLSKLPGVDAARIGMTGASGGGTQTFLLAAVDDRLSAAAPVNMVSGIMQGGCVCENAPGLRIHTNNIEIAATFAPKPLLLVAATGDWTRDVPRVEFPAIRAVYHLLAKADAVSAVQFDAPHNYNQQSREAVYDFLRRTFTPNEAPWRERSANVPKLNELAVFHNRTRPAHARTFAQIFEEWKTEARTQARAATPAEIRERLMAAASAEWPERVEASGAFLSRPGRGDEVPYKFLDGQGPAVLLLHPDGIAAAEASPEFTKFRDAKRAVLLIDAFQTGSAKAPRDRSHNHFLTFNPSDDAARLQDVLTALRFLSTRKPGRVVLSATGTARWWALFGAAMAPVPTAFTNTPSDFELSDDRLAATFFVPGLQRAGGAQAALRLLTTTP
jgi:dienelactone hydrolase